MKRAFLSGVALLAMHGFAFGADYETYFTLQNDQKFEVEQLAVLADGTVVMIVSDKALALPTHICHLHHNPEKSNDDECRRLGH